MKITYFPTNVSRIGKIVLAIDLEEGEYAIHDRLSNQPWWYKRENGILYRRIPTYRSADIREWHVSMFNTTPQDCTSTKVEIVEYLE